MGWLTLKKWVRLLRFLCSLHDMLLLTVFAVLILISGYCLYDNLYIYSHALGEELLQYKPVMQGTEAKDSPITEDMVAWLTVDGTNIDYPVMQGKDNYEYLNKDPYGNFSLSGSVFLDSHNSADFSDDYSLLYGHHMAYGKMFGALDAYLDETFARQHTHVSLLIGRNGEVKRELEIFAVMKAKATTDEVFNVDSQKDVTEYVYRHADFLLSEPKGRILALSTCSETAQNDRVLVLAYFKDEETAD